MGIVSGAIIKLTLITILGYYLYKKSIINEKVLDFLIFFVINFTLPFLSFSHIIENLKFDFFSILKFLSLSFVIFFIGLILGLVFSFKRTHNLKREFISLVSFQNAGYLPLNIVFFLLPENLKKDFIVYIFLYILGFDIIMWSVGSFFIFKKKNDTFHFKSIFTPPVIATLFGLFFVYTNIKVIPSILLSSMGMIGNTSFVLSMLILGCWLAKVKLQGVYKNLCLIGEAIFLKLIVVPLIFLFLVMHFEIFSLFGFFIILQASMPSAVSLPIIVNFRKADSEFVSQGVFISHIFSIFTIPFWLGLYFKFSGFSFL